ncbi:putative lipid II flippase FtsW [Patescibacteria group bacterium]|nr:putative lipid II flippase FtsW [Patescibacteria group bacterium]
MRKFLKVDHILLGTILLILLFGIVMITSIGVPKSLQLSSGNMLYPNCSSAGVDCYLLLKNHLMRVGVGLAALFVVMKMDYRIWRKVSLLLFIFSFVLLVMLFFVGDKNNTFATSWINVPLPFLNSIQPSEIAKLALVVYLASWLEQKKEQIKSFQYGFVAFCVISLIIMFPIIAQPDLGSAMVIGAIAVSIYFAAGAKVQHLLIGSLIAILASGVFISQKTYLKNRVNAFLHQDTECVEDYCWQSEQAKIAVGSGGFFGRGLTQGIQKSYWLPQASDDFIFAASAEELGFVRIILLVFAYMVIGYRGFFIANHAPNRFAALLAVGITTWVVVQAFVNIGVNISLLPITGITLPLVSYGGSSLVTTLIGLGILLNISQNSTGYAHSSNWRRNRGARRTKRRTYRRNA